MSVKRAVHQQYQQLRIARISRLAKGLMLLLATLLSFLAASLVVADQLLRPESFVIENITIKGRFNQIDPVTIERTIRDMELNNFFAVDLEKIKAKIEAMQWVQSADVRRDWPNGLAIDVAEHQPVMRWNKDKWLNAKGEVVNLSGQISSPYSIELFGNDADSVKVLHQSVVWSHALQARGLELMQLSLSASHAWRLQLKEAATAQEFELLLGSDDVANRFSRFMAIYPSKLQQGGQRVQRIDARYPDGFAIFALPETSEKQKG